MDGRAHFDLDLMHWAPIMGYELRYQIAKLRQIPLERIKLKQQRGLHHRTDALLVFAADWTFADQRGRRVKSVNTKQMNWYVIKDNEEIPMAGDLRTRIDVWLRTEEDEREEAEAEAQRQQEIEAMMIESEDKSSVPKRYSFEKRFVTLHGAPQFCYL